MSGPRTPKKKVTKRKMAGPTHQQKTPWARYPFASLFAFYVAEQSYCEKRVELWLKNPGELISVPREAEQSSAEAVVQERLAFMGQRTHHELAAGAVPLQPEELAVRLQLGGRVWLVESPLRTNFRGIPLVGAPDAVCFEEGKARSVIEYKVTDSNQLQMSHRVQLLIYGYLLEESGVDVHDLLLSCVLIPREHAETIIQGIGAEAAANQFRDAAAQIVERQPGLLNWNWLKMPVGDGASVNLRVFRYVRANAERELEFFEQFWSGSRPPMPTTKPAKCAQCLYNAFELCSTPAGPYVGLS